MNLKRIGWAGALCALAVACGGEVPSQSDDTAGVAESVTGSVDTDLVASAAMVAILEKADAADGTTDKVVSNCVTCGLDMKGSADHAAQVGDYEVHLCSEKCQSHFNEDPEAAVTGLDLK
jgi:hypothetical protein